MRYTVILQKEDDGGYVVTVPILPGCVSQGDTRAEALRNIEEAIELYVEGYAGYGRICSRGGRENLRGGQYARSMTKLPTDLSGHPVSHANLSPTLPCAKILQTKHHEHLTRQTRHADQAWRLW